MLRKCWKVDLTLEIVSEYGQEIPQSQTADKPMTPQEEPHNNHEKKSGNLVFVAF